MQIYTSSTCGDCSAVKRFLDHKGKDYDEINITDDPSMIDKIKSMTGQMRVPVVVTKRGIAVGYNPKRLSEII